MRADLDMDTKSGVLYEQSQNAPERPRHSETRKNLRTRRQY